jgi:hypothetical protein
MFRRFFDRLGAGSKGKRIERGPSVVQPAAEPAAETLASHHPEVVIDDSLVALSRELSGLTTMQVPQAAKERGWASLQRELERRPVRAGVATTKLAAAGAGAKGAVGAGRAHRLSQNRLRLMLASAAAVVVIATVLLSTFNGDPRETAGTDPTTATSVVSSDSTAPDTTASTVPDTTATSLPETTVPTEAPTSTEPSQPETTVDVTTPGTGSTGGTTVPTNSGGSTGTTGTPTQTTQPPRTTTTGETQNAASQREGSAKAAAAYLANVALSGDTSGASGLVAAEAQTSLAQMVMSLNDPFGYRVPASGIKSLSDGTVRVTVEVDDRVLTGQGELVEKVKTFYVRVRVGDDGALVVAINAGPVR